MGSVIANAAGEGFKAFANQYTGTDQGGYETDSFKYGTRSGNSN